MNLVRGGEATEQNFYRVSLELPCQLTDRI